jgi:hypothetical protein
MTKQDIFSAACLACGGVGLVLAWTKTRRLKWLRKNSQRVIPKGRVCPKNLLFLGFGEEKQIPRFARDDKKALFPQPVKPALPKIRRHSYAIHDDRKSK